MLYFTGFIGIVILILGLIKLNRYRQIQKLGIRAKGVIAEVIKDNSGESITYWPVVTYTTFSGETLTGKTDIAIGYYKKYKPGDSIQVLYTDRHPEKFIINDNNYLYGMLAFLVASAVLIGISVYYIFFAH